MEFDMIIPDANLKRETLEFIQQTFKQPMVFDPISKRNAEDMKRLITSFGTIKMRACEAECITGMRDAGDAVRKLIDMGAKQAFVLAGDDVSFYADDNGAYGHTNAIPVKMVNATGVDDAYTAGVAYGRLMGMGAKDCAYFANACASITMEGQGAVNSAMSLASVYEMLESQDIY